MLLKVFFKIRSELASPWSVATQTPASLPHAEAPLLSRTGSQGLKAGWGGNVPACVVLQWDGKNQ